MKKLILPNTFLIGAQKAATTSVYSWLSQHPDVCAPMSVKDYAFFTRDDFYEKGLGFLSDLYSDEYNNEQIILQGSVHYIFFEKALKRISEFDPKAKFILILRNPVERAISAYEYALKFNHENLAIKEAFRNEDLRMKSEDHRVISELTYKNHGLYYKQIQVFLKYFNRDQLKILLYEEITDPKNIIAEVFNFLKVDSTFVPEFKAMNVTGKVKNKALQKALFGNSKLKNWIISKFVNKILSNELKAKIRWKIIHFNTVDKKTFHLDTIDDKFRLELIDFFEEDICKLEEFLSINLNHWKN